MPLILEKNRIKNFIFILSFFNTKEVGEKLTSYVGK